MNRNLKAQAAVEFLATYGWAILIVVAGISALAYFGVFDLDMLKTDKCYFSTGITCKDFQIDQEEQTVKFVIKNNLGSRIEDVKVSIPGCNSWVSNGSGIIKNGEKFTAEVTDCLIGDGTFNIEPIIEYTTEAGIDFKDKGLITGKRGDSGSGIADVQGAETCTQDSDCISGSSECREVDGCYEGLCTYTDREKGSACGIRGICAEGDCIEGLMAWWNIDDGSGGSIAEPISGYTGTLYGGAWRGSGCVYDQCLEFDGKTDYVLIPSNPAELDVDPGETRSYEIWFKGGFQDTELNRGTIFWKEGCCKGWDIMLYNSGNVRFAFNTGDVAPCCSNIAWRAVTASDKTYTDNQWHHAVGVVDRPNLRMEFFVDGASKGTSAIDNVQDATGGSARIATDWDTTENFTGTLDEIRVWDVPLNLSQVQKLYAMR